MSQLFLICRQVTPKEELQQPVPLSCAICGDDATGKHYGSISCDGCKGFFRRSVRRHSQYVCRQSKTCSVTRDKRNQCRYCRLRKCFKCGMKKEAVQNERDKISRHRPSEAFLLSLTVDSLKKADVEAREFCNFCFGTSSSVDEKREANVIALCAALKIYSTCLIDWASRIAPFNELSRDDQMVLCRSKAVHLFVFELAFRSIHASDSIILFDNCIISTFNDELDDTEGSDITKIGELILEEMVNPLTDYQIDGNEFSCLKAALFFDPNVRGLSTDMGKIRNWRQQITSNLMEYISDRENTCDRNARCAEIWLLLLPLQRISYQLIDLVQYAVLSGEVPIDSLINDILSGSMNLASTPPDRFTPRLSGDGELQVS